MTKDHDAAQDEGFITDLKLLERMALGRRRILSLGAVGGLAALAGACAGPGGGADGPGRGDGPPDGFPPGGRGGHSGRGPGGGPPPGGFGGPPPGPPPQQDNGPLMSATAPDGTRCVTFAHETEGPFPADGSNTARGAFSNALAQSGIQRPDIRGDLGGGMTAPGVPLEITLKLADVNMSCMPLASYPVYLWHCDASGQYSLYDKLERTWLRGLQVADGSGIVRFRTIFPGCYGDRYPHIHFEVFSSLMVATQGKFARLTSQLAMPADICDQIYKSPDYARSAAAWPQVRDVTHDMVFADNGSERLAAMTPKFTGDATAGLKAEVLVGLAG